MKISERRIKEIIAEEMSRAQHENTAQIESLQYQLQNIALQAAMLHDGLSENAKISDWAAKKLNSLAEDIDDVYYHFSTQKTGFYQKKDS